MRTKTFFISDLHLGAAGGNVHDHERRIAAWLRRIKSEAKTLYLLGDILDYWYEYRYVVPRGYVRFFGALAELADDGVEIIWLKGNHDIWIYDYLPAELGIKVVDGSLVREINGRTFFLEHGDGVGEMKRSYRILYRFFRNKVCQRLYSAIHPRWTVAFAQRWSRHSRLHGNPEQQTGRLDDNDVLVRFANEYMKVNGPIDYFVFGHRHRLVDQVIDNGAHLVIIGEAYSMMSYAEWDGTELKIKFIGKED